MKIWSESIYKIKLRIQFEEKRGGRMKFRSLIGMLLVLVMLGTVASAQVLSEQNKVPLKSPGKLTKEELKVIYKKYKISENDIKFAKNKLPYVMAGTLLDGSKKVIITEDGKLPERIKKKVKSIGYDFVISKKEAIEISEKAKQEYIKKYGVDPDNPKVIMYKGTPLPKEYINELVRRGIIKPPEVSDTVSSMESNTRGPHQINGKIYVEIFIAKDSAHRPEMSFSELESKTDQALDRFKSEFGVTMSDIWYLGFWNASDVSDTHNASQVLDDLKNDCSWVRDSNNEIVFGWADDLDHNGIAYLNGFYAVGSENPIYPFDWPEKSVVQHEISHNFNAPDHGYFGPYCIMTYFYGYLGVDKWCKDCWNTVYGNIWGLWE